MEAEKALKTITAGLALVVVLVALTVSTRAAEGKSDKFTEFIEQILGLGSRYEDPVSTPGPDGRIKPATKDGGGNLPQPWQPTGTGSVGGDVPYSAKKTGAKTSGDQSSGFVNPT